MDPAALLGTDERRNLIKVRRAIGARGLPANKESARKASITACDHAGLSFPLEAATVQVVQLVTISSTAETHR